MFVTIATEEDLEAVSELMVDAAFREGVFHLVEGQLVFTCEVLRAVPDKAEEYWMGPIHRTRIPWTKCLMEFIGVTRCEVKELDEPEGAGQMLLMWEKHGGRYVVRLRTPFRMEFQLTLAELFSFPVDYGSLWEFSISALLASSGVGRTL